MIKYQSFVLFVILFLGCSNPKSKQVSEIDEDLLKTEIQVLDTTLIRFVDYIRETTTVQEIGNIHIDSLIVGIRFNENEDIESKRFFGVDSVIFISYFVNNNTDFNESDFRGIVDLNDYKIAVFDKNNIGKRFYSSSELKQIELTDLYRPQINVDVIRVWQIKGDSLVRWALL